MKMKWKQLLYALMIGAGATMSMTACSDSEHREGPNEEIDDDIPEGYFSFRSTIESATNARDLDPDPYQDGERYENKVNRLRVVLYDDATNIAEYAYDYNGTFLHSVDGGSDFLGSCMAKKVYGNDPSLKGFAPKPFKIKIKPYKLLVLVNPNDALVTQTKAKKEFVNIEPDGTPAELGLGTGDIISNYTIFRERVGLVDGNDLTVYIGKENYVNGGAETDQPNNFLMSNYQEAVKVTTAQIKPTPEKAEETPISVKLDRAVAKVSMTAKYIEVSSASNATVKDGKWRLDITNKKGYWFRHMTKALGSVDETLGMDRTKFYAEDPNFNHYSSERYLFNGQAVAPEVHVSEYADNFSRLTDVADVNIPIDGNWSYEYALENTMVAEEQYEDVTTAAILGVIYIPKKSALDSDIPEDGRYFVWKGYVFTAKDLENIRDYDIEAQPGYETFNELKKHLKDNASVLEASGTGFGSNYTSPGTTSKKVLDITYNHDGNNYYRVLIRHFGDDQEAKKMAYGRFGIVRNNWYRLTLKSISAPGDIDIPDPIGPDDKDQHLGIAIEVLPWLVRNQDVHID